MRQRPTSMIKFLIRPATPEDADQVAAIYNPYVLDTAISFEESPVEAAEMAGRIRRVLEAGLPWLVAEHGGQILGYAYATRWRERHAYRFSVECTAYVASGMARSGVGSALYSAMFPLLRQTGYHAVVAVIALPNAASVALHERFGLKKVAHYPEIGYKFERWHDVGTWQALL